MLTPLKISKVMHTLDREWVVWKYSPLQIELKNDLNWDEGEKNLFLPIYCVYVFPDIYVDTLSTLMHQNFPQFWNYVLF